MELDPDEVFRDDEDDPENDFYRDRESSKELVVYLVDASPKMFSTTSPGEDQNDETHFQVAVNCIAQSLKTQIINRFYDEVAICFFNTREKKNLQDLNGVYVFNVAERENLDRPTARLIKEFDCIEESFIKQIGSQYGILSGSRDNSLYNALWVAQALLRKGSSKTADKRILLFTNEDDPFGSIKGATKTDMMRTTLQRAKDAQDLGISIELLPFRSPNEEFNASLFYGELLGLEGDDLTQFMPSAAERFEDMKNQLRKRMFKKRKVRRITFVIASALSIELNTYALIRPTVPGKITWLDSVTNLPLQNERSFFCTDTGEQLLEPPKRTQSYKNEEIKFSVDELSEIKRVSTGHLRLLGFKPLSCLKDYHNLRPSTFLFPSDEVVIGNTCIFIALHRSMLQLKRFAAAFYGSSSVQLILSWLPSSHKMSVRVLFNYGGTFVNDPVIKYVGGSVEVIENVGLEYMSLLGLSEFHFKLNPVPHVNIYFLAPDYEVSEGGALLLRNDKDVFEMVDLLVNNESEELVLFAVEMDGPLAVVGMTEDEEDVVEIDKNETFTEKANQSGTDKGKQTSDDQGKQTEKGKKPTKQSMKRNQKKGNKDNGEEVEHCPWMDEDLEGPEDDNIFEEGKKKTDPEKVKDVFVED